jgi:hypothetical protein
MTDNIKAIADALADYVDAKGFLDVGGLEVSLHRRGDTDTEFSSLAVFLASRGVIAVHSLP